MSKTNVATNSEPGIIGQMYEDRKSKKRGVLESRETKYKTLMFRAEDGSSFNITYSTFRSNWRKYVGDEIVQTSTQVEEQRAEEEKREESNKQIVESKSEVVKTKISTEEKVKKVRAVEELVVSKIKSLNTDIIKTTRTSRGCVIVQYKKKTLFEIWTKFNIDMFDLCVLNDIAEVDSKLFKSVIANATYTNKEKWHLPHLLRIKNDEFETTLNSLLTLAIKFAEAKEESNNKEEK